MIAKLAYTLIFGKPLIMYLGILTLVSLLLTASIGLTSIKGIKWLPFKYHIKIATLTIILAIIHALFALSVYLNF